MANCGKTDLRALSSCPNGNLKSLNGLRLKANKISPLSKCYGDGVEEG